MNPQQLINLPAADLAPDGREGKGPLRYVRRKFSRDVKPDNPLDPADQASAASELPRDAGVALLLDDVLPGRYFVKQLHREKRRADRSGSALSVATFRVDAPEAIRRDVEQRLASLLLSTKRETDIVGYLNAGRIAVILTDTSESGALEFQRKISKLSSGLPVESQVRTYPHDLFDDLHHERRPAPEEDPLHLDARVPAGTLSHVLKRCLDIVGASTALVLFSPVMLITALAIATTSSGPVIFKQTRLGRGGVPFAFYKFRSMFTNTDDRIHREYVLSIIKKDEQKPGEAPKAWAKLEHDPRITPVGRFIRKTSIDELPQLFNVLQGHLSLVGPRPPLPYEAAEYESWHLRRVLEVQPGITGLWQVAGRGATTFEDMVRLDIQYIKNWSLASDIKILFKTVAVVLRRNGAK